jgi:hypothetical protein
MAGTGGFEHKVLGSSRWGAKYDETWRGISAQSLDVQGGPDQINIAAVFYNRETVR